MGKIAIGDLVIGANGRPTAVTAVHERGERAIYRLTFSDGATVEACDEHLWSTWTKSSLHRQYERGPKKGQRNVRPAAIRTTEQIRELVINGRVVHIPVTGAVEYADAEALPLDPYAVGLLLGDGGLSKPNYPTFTSGDPELLDSLRAALPAGDSLTKLNDMAVGIKGCGTAAILRALGLMAKGSLDKFIPEVYVLGTPADRLALLQGLLDTDGGMESKSIKYTTVSPQLATQVQDVVRSLGGTCRIRTKEPSYLAANGERVACKTAYGLTMRLPIGVCPFRLGRKVSQWEDTRPAINTPPRRTVKAVEYIGPMAARCITVDAEDHLYLTDDFVVTHNSWMAVDLSGSERVGQTYTIDLGEGSTDEYGAIPGARFLVVEHDGTFGSILRAVEAVRDEARRAADAGEPPVVLVIDSVSQVWDLLKDWAAHRAKGSKANQTKLRQDPDAEISIPMNLWNDATARWRRLMTILMTFPGIAVITARGKEVAAMDASGRPIEGSKEYKVDGQKGLAFDCTVWLRVSREHPPMVIGARSVHAGVRPGTDKPRPAPGMTLERLVFDVLKCDPAAAHVRDLVQPQPVEDDSTPDPAAIEFRDRALKAGMTVADLRGLHGEVKERRLLDAAVIDEHGDDANLGDLIVRLGHEARTLDAARTADARSAAAGQDAPAAHNGHPVLVGAGA